MFFLDYKNISLQNDIIKQILGLKMLLPEEKLQNLSVNMQVLLD